MIFDGRPVDEISDDEIDELVSAHVSERQHLEFKVTVSHQNDEDRLELLRDVSSLANAGGGYIIIGIRDDGKGRAQTYEPYLVGDAQKIKQAIMSLCLEHISDRIDGLEVKLRTVNENPIVIVRIPTSIRIPHMVTFQHHTDFYTRYEDGKREMTLSEIREAFNQDLVARRLDGIESQLNTIINTPPTQKLEESQEETIEGILPRFLGIRDGNTLANETFRSFTEEVADQPFFRIAITSLGPEPNLVDVNSERILALIESPPGSRRMGWNVDVRYGRIERFAEGIRRGDKGDEYLELQSNGHMEFWSPLNEHFCWRQSPEEFKQRPRLYPYPVVEYPTTFIRLYRALIDTTGIGGEFVVDLHYLNLKGYVLAPYAPNAIGFMFADHYSKPFENQHLGIPRRKIKADFDPDKIAYEIIQVVYATFGFDASAIPFFTSEGIFDFPS
ncbi:helix-turn-helix domain-containing protein [Chloroflexota bacterium]